MFWCKVFVSPFGRFKFNWICKAKLKQSIECQQLALRPTIVLDVLLNTTMIKILISIGHDANRWWATKHNTIFKVEIVLIALESLVGRLVNNNKIVLWIQQTRHQSWDWNFNYIWKKTTGKRVHWNRSLVVWSEIRRFHGDDDIKNKRFYFCRNWNRDDIINGLAMVKKTRSKMRSNQTELIWITLRNASIS